LQQTAVQEGQVCRVHSSMSGELSIRSR